MKRILKFIPLIIILILVIVVVAGVWSGYNGTVDMRETVDSNESEVRNRLQQRHDKMEQLISAIEGLQDHAEDIYNRITEARAAYAKAAASGTSEDYIAADALETSVLFAFEDNPYITATQGYLTYMDEVSAMENALAVARRDYNEAVQKYNAAVRKFPRVLYIGIFGFEKELPYWEVSENAGEVPLGNFSD
jgi:LemA protein